MYLLELKGALGYNWGCLYCNIYIYVVIDEFIVNLMLKQRAFVFAGNDAFEWALFGDAEDDNVEFAFAAEGEGGRIHDFEIFVQSFVKGLI